MDWKSLGQGIAALGLPLLGAALPIPGGAAIGAALASAIGSKSGNPDDIFTALNANADALQRAKEFEAAHQETMLKLQLDFETQEENNQSAVIMAEANGSSWLQRNWRPLMMVWFGVILGLYWFGIQPKDMTQATIDHLFTLLQLGIGGYIGGRSVEKIAMPVMNAIANRGQNS